MPRLKTEKTVSIVLEGRFSAGAFAKRVIDGRGERLVSAGVEVGGDDTGLGPRPLTQSPVALQ